VAPEPRLLLPAGCRSDLDLGPYYIANLINLIGPVKRVGALTSIAQTIRPSPASRERRNHSVKTPTTIQALLEFVSGATVDAEASWDVWSHRHANMELYGTDGTLYVPDPNFFGGKVEASGRDKDIKELDGWDHPFGIANQETLRVRAQLSHRRSCRHGGIADRRTGCALLSGQNAARVDVMTSILRSGEEGRFVDLTTSVPNRLHWASKTPGRC